jgi:hypothetical protein
MSRFRLLNILLVFLLFLVGCGRRVSEDEAPELKVEMQIIPSPPNTGSTLLMIKIVGEEGVEIGDFMIDVRGDMSHAGMTPVIVTEAKGELGTYAVPFEWTMAGDWIITISAKLPDGRNLIRTLPVQVEP